MRDESQSKNATNGASKFGLIEAVVLGAVFVLVVTQGDPADRLRRVLLLLAVCASYLALVYGLANLQTRLAEYHSAAGDAIKLGLIEAVVLGTASAVIVLHADLSNRPRMVALLLGGCASYFALVYGLARVQPRTAAVSWLLTICLTLVIAFIKVDEYCLELNRPDWIFATLMIAAINIVLFWAVLRVCSIGSPDGDGQRGGWRASPAEAAEGNGRP